jgi:hypothetical protein
MGRIVCFLVSRIGFIRRASESRHRALQCGSLWRCSLTGVSGITLTSRLLNKPWKENLKDRFEKALDEDFTQQDGTIMSIRSEMTGFTVHLPPIS